VYLFVLLYYWKHQVEKKLQFEINNNNNNNNNNIKFEVSTALTMKSAVYCDIKYQLRFLVLTVVTKNNVVYCDIKSQLRFEVFTVVTMKKSAVFWDVMPCCS
jgi:hypothetical protein